MNVFSKILAREHANDTRLGCPSTDSAAMHRRLNAMAAMTNSDGFSIPPAPLRTDAQGKTRGQRKREARAVANAKVSEARAPQFMHSAARRRAGYDATPRPMTGFPLQVAA